MRNDLGCSLRFWPLSLYFKIFVSQNPGCSRSSSVNSWGNTLWVRKLWDQLLRSKCFIVKFNVYRWECFRIVFSRVCRTVSHWVRRKLWERSVYIRLLLMARLVSSTRSINQQYIKRARPAAKCRILCILEILCLHCFLVNKFLAKTLRVLLEAVF